MFDSITNIFSLPIVRRPKYQTKPSLKSFIKKHRPHKTQIKSSTNLIQCLAKPIQQWILHHQNHLKSHSLNRIIYEMIIQNSHNGRKKEQDMQSRVSVHNLFVLMVQYQILGQFLKEITTTQLQLMIDGICSIYLKTDNDSIQELTCLLHHITTKSRMRTQDKVKEWSIFKPFDIQNTPFFLSLYSSLQSRMKDKFYPTVVRVIPMFSELIKIIVKTNPTENKNIIMQKIPWLSTISLNLLSFINKDTNEITLKQTSSIEFQNVVVQDVQNAQLKKKMVDFAKKACKIAGFVSSKELFMYACRQLYFFQHTIKLNKRILQLVYDIDQVNLQNQKTIIQFVRIYLQAILNFDINLPDNQIKSLIYIFRLSEFTCKDQIIQIGLAQENTALNNFIEAVQKCEHYQWNTDINPNPKKQHPEFFFQKQQTILSYFLRLVFNLQVQYFQVINIILQKSNKKFILKLQYYLIKNGLLHFLVQEQQAILGNDHKMHKVFFKMISNLVKFNPYCYRIFDQILQISLEKQQRSLFIEQIRKNFYLSKQFLISTLADTLSVNCKQKPTKYFLPYCLELLLYHEQKSKHDIWISYIHDVIIRDLVNNKVKKVKIGKRDETIDQVINQWVTIAIMIQIEYVNFRRGGDLELGEFTMNYLTNILNEAIKWKYEDQTEVMRRILGNYQQWQTYYTEVILSSDNNQDLLQTNLGTTVNFLFLKRWNRKICNSIKLFIQSVITTQITNDLPLFQNLYKK